jgi:hypothetical protein
MAQDDGQGAFSFSQPGMKIRSANRTAGSFDQKAILIYDGQRVLNHLKMLIGRRHNGRPSDFRHDVLSSDTRTKGSKNALF